jgi:hypothetical protein
MNDLFPWSIQTSINDRQQKSVMAWGSGSNVEIEREQVSIVCDFTNCIIN